MHAFKRHLSRIASSIVIAVAVYIIGVLIVGGDEIRSAAARLDVSCLIIALGLSLAHFALRFLRWRYFLRSFGYRLHLSVDIVHYLAGFALTTTPGKIGETIRSIYLEKHGVRYTESLAAFFSERLLDVLIVSMLATLVVDQFADGRWLTGFAGCAVIIVLAISRNKIVIEWLETSASSENSTRITAILNRIGRMLRSASGLLKLRSVLLGSALGLGAWAAQGIGLFVIAKGVGIDLPIAAAIGVYTASILVGAFSMIPGGIGSTETAMSLLLIMFGADAPTAVAAAIISRLATIWFAVAIGLLATTILELIRSRG